MSSIFRIKKVLPILIRFVIPPISKIFNSNATCLDKLISLIQPILPPNFELSDSL